MRHCLAVQDSARYRKSSVLPMFGSPMMAIESDICFSFGLVCDLVVELYFGSCAVVCYELFWRLISFILIGNDL